MQAFASMNFILFCLASLVVVIRSQYVMQPPVMSLLKPQGLRMAIPDEEGITLFAVHYSINKPVPGVSAGDYNYDVTAQTGNEWVHENTAVLVNVGDVVYYWTHVDHQGLGYDLTEQSWIAVDGESTTTSTTAGTTVTTASTTTTTAAGTTTTSGSGGTTSATSATTPGGSNSCAEYPCLIFEDNFDSLDLSKWKHEITLGGGGNWEFQYYSNNRSNSYTREGNLYIKPTLTSDKYSEAFLSSGNIDLWGAHPGNLCTGNAFYGCQRQGTGTNYVNVVQSARLRTAETFSFRYGRMEVRAQTPRGDWIWPAIWLLPLHEPYGNWPASGEIDLMESRGNSDLRDGTEQVGNSYAGTTLHWGPFWPYNKYDMTSQWKNDNFGDAFHTYTMDWTPTSIVVYFDGQELMRVVPGAGGFWTYGGLNNELPPESNPWQYASTMAPFDEEFYIILNVAVGGTNGYFSDSWVNGGYPKPWVNTSPTALRDFWLAKNSWYPTWNPTQNNGEDAALKVDYVRVWKLEP